MMQIFDFLPLLNEPTLFTVGTFDAIHKGHQHLLKKMALLKKDSEKIVVMTFKNHPQQVITPSISHPLWISTLDHRLYLLEQFKVDITILVPFTSEFASMTYDVYLKKMHHHLHFSHFFRGINDPIGKNLTGSNEKVAELGEKLGYIPKFIPKLEYKNSIISSSLIRKKLLEGNLQEVEVLLGRPYSIYLKSLPKDISQDAHHTILTLDLKDFCLPKKGKYQTLFYQKQKIVCHTQIDEKIVVCLPKKTLLELEKPFELFFS